MTHTPDVVSKRLFTVPFPDTHLLVDGDLRLCIVQTEAPDFDAVEQDVSRPQAIELLRRLFRRDGVMGVCTGPLVMVLPEYALGSGDWAQVDEVVHNVAIPLVLIVGFGAAQGEHFEQWGCGTGRTERIAATGKLGPDGRYAGGWCWVHQPGEFTRCVAFAKNHPEQNDECFIIETAPHSVSLEFADLTLYPMLCADLLAISPDDPLSRMEDAERESALGPQPLLVTGSLWQDPPYHSLWGTALQRIFNTRVADRTVLALANHAFDQPVPEEKDDSRRSFSGVFISKDHFPKRSKSTGMLRTLTGEDSYAGFLLRRTTPSYVLASVRWPPFTSGQGAHFAIEKKAAAIPSMVAHGCRHEYELVRFLRRHRPDPLHAQYDSGIRRVTEGIGSSFRGQLLQSTILHGVDHAKVKGSDSDLPQDKAGSVIRGLKGLSALFASEEVEWVPGHPHTQGQAVLKDGSAHLLVWDDAERDAHAMKMALQEWQVANPLHPPLVVLNEPYEDDHLDESVVPDSELGTVVQMNADGAALEGPIIPNRRTRFSDAPPPEDERDITGRVRWARVECLGLKGIINIVHSKKGVPKHPDPAGQIVKKIKDRLK